MTFIDAMAPHYAMHKDGLWSGWRSHPVNGELAYRMEMLFGAHTPNFTRGVPSAGLGELFFQTYENEN